MLILHLGLHRGWDGMQNFSTRKPMKKNEQTTTAADGYSDFAIDDAWTTHHDTDPGKTNSHNDASSSYLLTQKHD